MGGFIKVTLREENKITTDVLYTSALDDMLADYKNIFENDISEMIKESAIDKEKDLMKNCHAQIHNISPFDYGYIFIERVKRKVFFLNDYNGVSHF